VLVLENSNPKAIRKLLRRHNGRILAVAVVVEVESSQQIGALARFYNARPVPLPPELLLERSV
jgi:hypothetical protein